MNGITVTNSDHLPLGCGHTKCMTPQRNQIVAIVLLPLNLLATIPGLTALNLMKVPSVIRRKSETTSTNLYGSLWFGLCNQVASNPPDQT